MPYSQPIMKAIDDLLALKDGLPDCELQFVEAISYQMERPGSLTDAQVAKVYEISERRCKW